VNDPRLRPGTQHCKCPSCGEYFTTVKNFDLHRTGNAQNRRCRDPSTVVNRKGKAVFTRSADGLWARSGGAYLGGVK